MAKTCYLLRKLCFVRLLRKAKPLLFAATNSFCRALSRDAIHCWTNHIADRKVANFSRMGGGRKFFTSQKSSYRENHLVLTWRSHCLGVAPHTKFKVRALLLCVNAYSSEIVVTVCCDILLEVRRVFCQNESMPRCGSDGKSILEPRYRLGLLRESKT